MDLLKRITIFLIAVLTLGMTMAAADNPAAQKGKINLMVVSDLGRNGYYDQKTIASLMGVVAEQTGPDAVIALGDTHHYQGVQSVDDPLWMTNYELIYSHPELQIEWCPVLGNHEYRGNAQAVIDYTAKSRRWTMPSRYYTRVFDHDGTRLKVVFIDTSPIIDGYHNDSIGYPQAALQDVTAQLKWLDSELSRNDNADWTIVVGHHPVYAQTPKDTAEREDMQAKVDPILRQHDVDMYICGHIHNFQHIRKNGIDYVVNTSGSLSRQNVSATDGTLFCNGGEGFSILTATPSELTVSMIDKEGKVIHQAQLRK